jgi:hypothetical protein
MIAEDKDSQFEAGSKSKYDVGAWVETVTSIAVW